jgi:GNAT superfamily N-acetyltransferase
VAGSAEPRFRTARPQDAPAVAALHADSWRRHYRGAYSDAFLDGDVTGHLLEQWARRLASPSPQARTIIAEHDGAVVGLAHVALGEDPAWGSLLDNLHVAFGRKRHGIGTRLMALTARAVLDFSPASGLYLWVLAQNTAAQAFYQARGGTREDSGVVGPPNGDPASLNGTPVGLRYAWRDPAVLLLPGLAS